MVRELTNIEEKRIQDRVMTARSFDFSLEQAKEFFFNEFKDNFLANKATQTFEFELSWEDQ